MGEQPFVILSFERDSDYRGLLEVPGLSEDQIVRIVDSGHLKAELATRPGVVALSTHGRVNGEEIGPDDSRGWVRIEELGLERAAADTIVVLACYQRRERWAAARAKVHTYRGQTTPGNYKRVLGHLLTGAALTQEFTDDIRPGGASPYDPKYWQHPEVDAAC